ncbi:MAG TPA: energy transducer TonB [Gemmatimonadales bacterium]|nr:energy transducer TonB [Gemmatimonadales bacterium]
MFAILRASQGHFLKPHWLTTSFAMHALLIATAIVGTRGALDAPRIKPRDDMMLVFLPKPADPPPPPVIKPENHPVIDLADPPAQGFQTVAALTEIPDVIPPVDLSQRPLDPHDFTGRGVEGGVANGVVGGTGKVTPDAIYRASTDLPGFEPAAVVSQPAPQYPAALQSVGLEGKVEVEFVIDTTGRVQPASMKMIESTYPAFEAEARRVLAGSTFRPAHLSGVPVRQLTRQAIRFVAAH